jgi:acetylornithine/N-succinyldiaminopimelate aminotransferase
MSSEAELVALGGQYLYPNYRQPPLVIARGRGSELWDKSGKRYLDMHGGIAVSTLGHAHPKLTAAIARQAGEVLHLSNYFYNEPNVRLAARLCQKTDMARAFFCNSGAEAMEAMLKLARRHYFSQGQRDRYRIVAFESSFHGRTLGALAATGQAKYRDGFGPLPGVTHVPYGDAPAVRAAMGPDVAGVLFEPVQGEGGVLPAPAGFVAELRRIADEHGALLLADEIQTGVGRTGAFLAVEHEGVAPDAIALAKGLGGGVPIGAMVCRAFLEGVLPPGSHGSTFGGNPLASAAALAVLDTMDEEKLLDNVAARGRELAAGLALLATKHERVVAGTRGVGLLQALVLRDGVEPRPLVESLRDAGLLVSIAGASSLRFSPPLVVRASEVEEALGMVDAVLGARP